MKKYIAFISLIIIIIVSVLVFNIVKTEQKTTKVFSEPGYILQTKMEGQKQDIERYYFNADANYRNYYNDKVIFKDTSGEKITIEKNNFLHYTNGSISSLTKGVILDLDNIEDDPIIYYTISANQVLKKSGENYVIKHLNKNLEFKNFICKITDNKYLICGAPITIIFQNGEKKEISGYIEIEYSDNEVVKLYNQEVTYQTVSSNIYIELPDTIKVNLSNKIISKNNENKMSLENMIINSDDNVEIVDIEDEKYKEPEENTTQNETGSEETNQTANETTNEVSNEKQKETTNKQESNRNNTNTTSTDGNNTQEQNSQTQSGTNNSESTSEEGGGSISIEGNDTTTQIDESQEGEETIEEEKTQFIAPVFKVENFEVDSISMAAKIKIEDEQSALIGNPIIKILRNDTGKTVYDNEESSGTLELDISVSSLTPDVEYTMVVQDTYKVEEIEYTKNFVYKIFRTKTAGIDFDKDYCTNNAIGIKATIEEDSKVKGADITILDSNEQVIESKKIEPEQNDIIEFLGLNSNTEYKILIHNILYDGQVITNGFQLDKKIKTLKEKPEIGETQFEIDKRNGDFFLSVKNLIDKDNGIKNCRYEIYDIRNENANKEPVLVVKSNKNEQVSVKVDENIIFRGVPYVFRLVVEFDDNEKIMEFESETSDVMLMEGVKFPTVRFEEKIVTFERIEGKIIVDDDYHTIELSNENKFTVIYTDSVGNSQSFTSSGSLDIPVKISGLRSNETYKFSVYTRVNLQDYNDPIEECYIGGVVVKTKLPQELEGIYHNQVDNLKNTFTIDFQLQNAEGTVGTLEAETLTAMTFSIYAGQTSEGTPIKTVKVVDQYEEPYVSTLKQDYYDNSIEITPEFFGSNNKDFKDRYYTITVTNAYDYTVHQNKIPIKNNTFTVETKGYRPDLPVDVNNAIEVTEIRNRDKDQRTDLDPSTIVGYEVKAKYNNIDLYARKIIYKAFDANTHELIQSKEKYIGTDGVIPILEFEVGDGTPIDTADRDMLRRGNTYFFVYELYIDLNKDGSGETLYPYEEEGVELKSKEVFPVKQEAKIEMYPSTSTANSITYKYKISDIDNSLENNKITASINGAIRDNKVIVPSQTDTEFQEVTFESLSAGNFATSTTQILDKNQYASIRSISEFYFEGKITLNEIKYNVGIDSNRVIITLLNTGKKIDRIAAISVDFVGETKTIRKSFLYPDNNIMIVNLNELEELKKQTITVKVYAYYDTGLIGFDTDNEYKLFEKTYKNGENKYYCTLNNENNFTYTPSATQNMYIATIENNVLKVRDIEDPNKKANINLIKLEGGYSYQYDLINQKEVGIAEIESNENNTILFDYVIPGISLLNNNNELDITSELNQIKFKATITKEDSVQIENDLIYIDIFKTDENGNNEVFVKTEVKTLQEFEDYIIISGLQPKNYYYMRFKTKMALEDNSLEEQYLYDIDYQVLGKYYYFSTLANVEITDINISYNAVSYTDKTIDISYNLNKIFGYHKIVYTIQKLNEQTNMYETIMDNIQDTLFKREMLRQINCEPGTIFEFGKDYRVVIRIIANNEDNSGNIEEIEVGYAEKEFHLKELSKPIIGIKGSRPSENSIKFRITVYDNDKVIQNGKYTIRILNENKEDITPEQYVGKEYSISLINNIITVNNTEKTKSYTIEVLTNVDMNNSGTNIKVYKKSYTILKVNNNGISVGNVSATNDSVQKNKISLIFTDSEKLTEINQIKYSIYDTNGYFISGNEEFIPVENIINGEVIYTYTMDSSLQESGRYYIELQFLKNGIVIDNTSLDYTYIEE